MPIGGKGKQKQIIGTLKVSADCDFLSMQLIYAGKIDRCHPNGIDFPEGFNVTHTPNQLNQSIGRVNLKIFFTTLKIAKYMLFCIRPKNFSGNV